MSDINALNAVYDFMKYHAANDAETSVYAADATPRDTRPLSETAVHTIEQLCQQFNCRPKACYRNAQLLAIANPDLTYVEGYMYGPDLPIPIKHAWVEADGRVAEVTLPDGPRVPRERVYVGKPYDTETVDRRLTETETADPLALQEGLCRHGGVANE